MDIFTKAFQEQAEEYKGYGIELTFVFADSLGAEDMCRAAASVQVKDYDGILLNASGPELGAFMERAYASGIPVATFNSDLPGEQCVFFSGENHFSAGRLCGELTAKLMGGRGMAALFVGDETVFAQSERIRGFRDVLAKDYPDVGIIRLVSHGDDPVRAKTRAKELFEAEKLPDAVFCNSAVGGVPFCNYIQTISSKQRPLVIAYDDGPELVKMLNEGICTAIIYQEPVRQAKKALNYMFNALYYKKEWPGRRESQIMPSIVLKENSDVYFGNMQL